MVNTTKTSKCCICHRSFIGYGNNAQPYKDGYCCNECNNNFVIPKRIELYFNSLEEREDNT